MAAEVDVPGVGRTDKKWVYAGGAAAVGIVGYAWIKHKNNAPAPAPVDPAADTGATGYAGTPGASSSAPISVDGTTDHIDTNAKWVQYAATQLLTYGWGDSAVVISALGKWLQHQPLTDQEINAVTSARGVAGDPPVGGPYPVVHAQPTPSGGGTTTPPPPPAGGGSAAGTAQVQQGWHVDQWVADMRAAGHTFTLDQFLAANAGKITWANNNGFIDLLPPDKKASGGPAYRVFGATSTVTLPG